MLTWKNKQDLTSKNLILQLKEPEKHKLNPKSFSLSSGKSMLTPPARVPEEEPGPTWPFPGGSCLPGGPEVSFPGCFRISQPNVQERTYFLFNLALTEWFPPKSSSPVLKDHGHYLFKQCPRARRPLPTGASQVSFPGCLTVLQIIHFLVFSFCLFVLWLLCVCGRRSPLFHLETRHLFLKIFKFKWHCFAVICRVDSHGSSLWGCSGVPWVHGEDFGVGLSPLNPVWPLPWSASSVLCASISPSVKWEK